jgi:hypothetical protein
VQKPFRIVMTSLWDSKKFATLPSDRVRLQFVYLLTCEATTSVGCYVLKPGHGASDLNMSVEEYSEGIDTLSRTNLIGFDKETNLVRIVGHLALMGFSNPKHATGSVRIARKLPDCDEKLRLFQDLRGQRFVNDAEIEREIARLEQRSAIASRYPIDREGERERGKEEREEAAAAARAHTREAAPVATDASAMKKVDMPSDPTDRERLLVAMGVDPVARMAGPSGSWLGQPKDMLEAAKWLAAGLTLQEQITVIEAVVKRNRQRQATWTPASFSYFNRAMSDFAAVKAQPLPAISGAPSARAGSDLAAKMSRWRKLAKS